MAAGDDVAAAPEEKAKKKLPLGKEPTRAQLEFMQSHGISKEDLTRPAGIEDRRDSAEDVVGTCNWPPLYDTKFVESLKAEQMQGEVSKAPPVEGLKMTGVAYKQEAVRRHKELEDQRRQQAVEAGEEVPDPQSPEGPGSPAPITGDVDYAALGYDPSAAGQYKHQMMSEYRARKAQGLTPRR